MLRQTTVSAKVTPELVEKAEGGLNAERLTTSEYLRLCLVYIAEKGRAPFEVPESSRNVKYRRSPMKETASTTFFG